MFGCYHNTGEGSFTPYHNHGGDVVINIGTAYFGIRADDGNFVMEKLVALTSQNPCIKMIELKLLQGAKPGKGGVLPAAKITKEIGEIAIACGYEHPSEFTMDDVDVAMGDNNRTQSLRLTYWIRQRPSSTQGYS